MCGHIADVITHAKFCDNQFRGFGVLIPPILPFFIGIAGRPYNSVSISVLQCDYYYYYHTNLNATATNLDNVNRSLVDAGKTEASISVNRAEVDNNTAGKPDST